MNFTITQEVSYDRVADLLIGAFDPASHAVSYWCRISSYSPPKIIRYQRFPEQSYRYCDVPLNEGGSMVLDVTEEGGSKIPAKKGLILDLNAIQRGLSIMAAKYPKHFADILRENDDNETADVFIQCCVLGDVIYG